MQLHFIVRFRFCFLLLYFLIQLIVIQNVFLKFKCLIDSLIQFLDFFHFIKWVLEFEALIVALIILAILIID